MRRLMSIAAAAFAAAPAGAGEIAQSGASAATYKLGACVRPAEPAVAAAAAQKGREAVKARNAAVAAYNAHVDLTNDYFECIAAEAARDLEIYYKAVSASLEAENAAAIARLDALRAGLK